MTGFMEDHAVKLSKLVCIFLFVCCSVYSTFGLDGLNVLNVKPELICSLPLGDGENEYTYMYMGEGGDPSIRPETPFVIDDKYIGIMDYMKSRYIVYDFSGKMITKKKLGEGLVFPYSNVISNWFGLSLRKYLETKILYVQMQYEVWLIQEDGIIQVYAFPYELGILHCALINNMLFGWNGEMKLYCSPEMSYVNTDSPAPYVDESAIKRAIQRNDPRFKGMQYDNGILSVNGKPWMENWITAELFLKKQDITWEESNKHKVKGSTGCYDGKDRDGNVYWGEFSITVMNKEGYFQKEIKYNLVDSGLVVSGKPVVNSAGDIFFIAFKEALEAKDCVCNLYRIKRQW